MTSCGSSGGLAGEAALPEIQLRGFLQDEIPGQENEEIRHFLIVEWSSDEAGISPLNIRVNRKDGFQQEEGVYKIDRPGNRVKVQLQEALKDPSTADVLIEFRKEETTFQLLIDQLERLEPVYLP